MMGTLETETEMGPMEGTREVAVREEEEEDRGEGME